MSLGLVSVEVSVGHQLVGPVQTVAVGIFLHEDFQLLDGVVGVGLVQTRLGREHVAAVGVHIVGLFGVLGERIGLRESVEIISRDFVIALIVIAQRGVISNEFASGGVAERGLKQVEKLQSVVVVAFLEIVHGDFIFHLIVGALHQTVEVIARTEKNDA